MGDFLSWFFGDNPMLSILLGIVFILGTILMMKSSKNKEDEEEIKHLRERVDELEVKINALESQLKKEEDK